MPNDIGNLNDDGTDNSFQSAFTEAQASQAQPPEQQATATPEPESTPVESTPPVEPPSDPSNEFDISAVAREVGLNVEGKSDADIVREIASQYKQLKPYAEYGQQLVPYADQINEYFNSQGKPVEQKPADEDEWSEQAYFQKQWNTPQWSESYDFAEQAGIVQVNPETGLYEAAPGREQMAMPLLNGMNEAVVARRQQWNKLMQGNLWEQAYNSLVTPLQKKWQEDMEKKIEERLSSMQTQSFVDKFESDNADWLYVKDQTTGQLNMTEKGREFYDAISQLKQNGISDPRTLIDFAKRMVAAADTLQPSQGQQQVQPQPHQAPAEQTSPEQVSAEKQKSFLENAMDKARHSPSSGGFTTPAPDHPVNVSETELNSMFVSGFKSGA